MRYLSLMPDENRKDATKTDSGDRTPSPSVDLRTLHLWQIQPVRDLLVIGVIAGTVYFGYAMRTVTVPLLIALTLAYLFEPVVAWLSARRRMNRPLAVILILALLGGFVSILLAIVVPLAIGQTLSFTESLRSGRYDGGVERAIGVIPEDYRAEARVWADRIIHPSSKESAEAKAPSDQVKTAAPATPTPEVIEATQELTPLPIATESSTTKSAESASAVTLDNPLIGILGAGAGRVYSIALTVLQLGLIAFLIPFYFYYFSVYWPSIVGFFGHLVPDERRATVFELVGEMDRAVAGFVRGRIVICVMMGVMFAIGWQTCGVPYGLALGLITGAFSVVPYLGGIGLPFAIIVLIADQFGLDVEQRMAIWEMLLWPSLVFVVVQTIEGYVLTPIIAGKATNLDPVTIVVAILAGGSIAGVYGMLLAIPIAACGKIAARRLLLPRIKEWARGNASDPLPIDRA